MDRLLHYSIQDRSAEAYAMGQLFESGYGTQNALSHAASATRPAHFALSRTRLKVGGLSAHRAPEGTAGSPFSREPKDSMSDTAPFSVSKRRR